MSSSYLSTGTASTEEDVQVTRVLSVLARGGVNSHATEMTPLQAAEELGLGSAEAEKLTQLLDDQEMLNRQFVSAGGFQADEVLYLSSTGKELLATYRRVGARAADVRSARYLAANKAILRWRDDDGNRTVLKEISGTPYGYFYGDSFRESELMDAFNNLAEHGMLTALGSFQDKTLGLDLTSKGKQCVIRYDADFEAFQAASGSTGVNNTYNVGNIGNFVAGDNHGTMNAWTHVQNPQDAAALLAAAVRIASLNGDFEGNERSEAMAKECHEELLEAASADTPLEQRQRLGEKIRSLASSAASKGTETAASVLATQGVTVLISLLTGIPVAG